jgi:1,4-dihydroxy-2-naphthoate octaprenyltransferase
VQAPLTITAALASIPPGIHLATLLLVNEFPDYEADMAAGKRTAVVNLGKPGAAILYHVIVFFPFPWVAAFVIAGIFPIWTLISLVTLPLAIRAAAVVRRHVRDGSPILAANKDTFLLHLAFNVLLAVGFFLG